MPWEEKTVEMSRKEFVEKVMSKEESMSDLCRQYCVTRKTGYKWLERFKSNEPLTNQSRKPFHTPNKTPDEIEQNIVKARDAHPAWGPRKLKKYVETKSNIKLPAHSTIADILKRNGKIEIVESMAHMPYKRFQRDSPNELWQADFKGDFALVNSERCFPLTVLDDHSRYSLCVEAKDNQQGIGVLSSFNRLFNEFGLPDTILTDNGNPWGVSQRTGYTKFEIWLMELDILPIHGRPLHPQTQGKEERFHRTMKAELLKKTKLKDMAHAQQEFDLWRHEYNYERPHEALCLDVPANHYSESKRKLGKVFSELEYYTSTNSRRVNGRGYFSYQDHMYFLSEAFGGKYIEIAESSKGGHVNVNFRNFRLAKINLDEQLFVSKKIFRLQELKMNVIEI